MPFIGEILKYHSVSIVGLEKNTGKTECLNYIIKRLPTDYFKIAVTSIGIDGESLDQVTSTAKPEITLREGMFFGTSEKYYRQRKILSELYQISEETTALGRVVTAKALNEKKVLLSGPSSGSALKRWISSLDEIGIDLVLIDGALSRLSAASPAISDAMILSTGAAFSANIKDLVSKTAFVVELINLPLYINNLSKNINEVDATVSSFVDLDSDILKNSTTIGVEGALTDRLLQAVKNELSKGEKELVVNDFTRIFVSPDLYRAFIRRGGKISVRTRSRLLAVCVNPTAPNGIVLDSDTLCFTLSQTIGLPVYDIVKNNYDNEI
ncbi:MAG: hypothetical protein PHD11_05985 [Bacteroidales bacterium]|nr:hypothetical protein [Bacteroidales bacterium]MDD4670915.1 hypothetical protein [Bacteroidales bacterium]